MTMEFGRERLSDVLSCFNYFNFDCEIPNRRSLEGVNIRGHPLSTYVLRGWGNGKAFEVRDCVNV